MNKDRAIDAPILAGSVVAWLNSGEISFPRRYLEVFECTATRIGITAIVKMRIPWGLRIHGSIPVHRYSPFYMAVATAKRRWHE
jgi:hypothetical protein